MDRLMFAQAVKNKKLQGVYLLEGTEESIKAAALSAVRKVLLPEGLEQLNESVMENPDTAELTAACETLPLMADKRLVIVREHAALSGKAEGDDKLAEYLQHVPDTTVLVFYHRGKADARKKLYKAIEKHGTVVSFQPMTENELNTWICSCFKDEGKSCQFSTASLLAFICGSDTVKLRNEIAKVAGHAGERAQVTDDDVRAVATRGIEYTVFNMVDAVVAGQESRAFALMRDMLLMGEERLGILAMLLRQYRILQHVKIMQYEKRDRQYMADALGVKPFMLERYIHQAQGLRGPYVKQAVDICLQTEYRVKSGRMNQEGCLEAALLQLFVLRRGM